MSAVCIGASHPIPCYMYTCTLAVPLCVMVCYSVENIVNVKQVECNHTTCTLTVLTLTVPNFGLNDE